MEHCWPYCKGGYCPGRGESAGAEQLANVKELREENARLRKAVEELRKVIITE